MIGRKQEIQSLELTLKKKKSSFIAVTGRRRVGKTYLIDQFYKRKTCFRITGIQDQGIEGQLKNFSNELSRRNVNTGLYPPKNWQDAFFILREYLETLDKRKKHVIFFDELPWISTPKSRFLQMLAHIWNDYLSKEKHFILIICGSASSWLTQKVINDKGGLHNRITDLINLQPFNLSETKAYLKSLSIILNEHEISKLYMTFGGVPYYLEQIRKGESANMAIERICFSNNGVLKNEYSNLYQALFKNAENHEAVVGLLAQKSSGLTRNEIIKRSKLKPGGQSNRTIKELLQCGFISEFIPYKKKKRGVVYRLNDEFSIFHHRFIKPNKKYTKGMWSQISASQTYKIWTGYAFENLCIKHIDTLKKAMGISAVYTEISSYQVVGTKEEKGFQIDLIIDRKDGVINLCEMKYYGGKFKINKKYAQTLQNRRQQFMTLTKTKKQVFNTLITNYGIIENEHSMGVVDTTVVLEELY